MDRAESRRRVAQRPHSVRLSELQQLLEAYGWTLDRSVGSHHIFRRGGQKLSVPFRRPHLRVAYVRLALQMTEGEDDDDD